MITIRNSSIKSFSNKKKVENANKEATIYLYGDIGGFWGIGEKEWVQEFNAIDASKIHLRINSDGGDIFAARSIKTAIMQHKAKVIAHIDGLAASAASFIATGADEVEIVDGGFIMVHKALSFVDIFGYFNEDDMSQLISELGDEKKLHEKINDTIANDYAKKTKKTKEEALGWMSKETWFTAEEAKNVGLADRIYDGEPIEGHYDLDIFDNPPEALKQRNFVNVKKTAERAMRDAGIPAELAKKIVAKGYHEEKREADVSDELKGFTINIEAMDTKMFVQMVNENPELIVSVIKEAMDIKDEPFNSEEGAKGQREVVDPPIVENDVFAELMAKTDKILKRN